MEQSTFKPNDGFCALCGAILPIARRAPCTMKCNVCLVDFQVNPINDKVISAEERVYERTVAETLETGTGDADGTEVEHVCPKCSHGLATYTTRQTRSADEGQTVFYTCMKCKHKCIEYS
uniref:DNA-directed RNA polymerase subunit n=1 Tax=Steinernema glaseri TaxID=37863 RepID=A0A1I7YDP2_9BILA